ncbi:hypothetical protein FE782_05695 [Paenibacillus antri]|uniref:NlpC/P60 domain-containing protein n=1 Tax=Paenibacillus antri TaxID=2582848 RepID=A0A5R9GHH3_9BACL|nr:C40 family peptidase [Paenibacillus antri]TLS52868.1 hypothetical protein FE782_05695 [Paenibacillus antri]
MRKWMTGAAAILVVAVGGTSFVASAAPAAVEAVLAPFRWSANGKSFSASATFHNGTESVPGSMNYKGTTYIPIRMAAEALGLTVQWDAKTSTATLVDSENDDDPVSDVPGKYPNASYTVSAKLVKSAALYRNMDEKGAVVGSGLKAGQSVVVLSEAGGWLKVVADGRIGYARTNVTDYVPFAQRPAWERTADSIIEAGLAYLGTPYEFDANLGQTATFDCSSFVNYLYEMHGMDMPRNSRQQSGLGKTVAFEDLRKGDLLFFTTPKRANKEGVDRVGHVAIYVGGGKVLHTFRVGIGVTVTQLDKNWMDRFISAKRVI